MIDFEWSIAGSSKGRDGPIPNVTQEQSRTSRSIPKVIESGAAPRPPGHRFDGKGGAVRPDRAIGRSTRDGLGRSRGPPPTPRCSGHPHTWDTPDPGPSISPEVAYRSSCSHDERPKLNALSQPSEVASSHSNRRAKQCHVKVPPIEMSGHVRLIPSWQPNLDVGIPRWSGHRTQAERPRKESVHRQRRHLGRR